MIALFLAPIYILLNIYVIRWLIKWMSACSGIFKKRGLRIAVIVIYSFFALSLLTGFLLPFRWLKHIASVWFGSILYIILTIAIVDLIRLILKYIIKVDREKLSSRKLFVTVGAVCVSLIIGVSAYGTINASHIRTTDYRVSIDKKSKNTKSLKIVLVADLHLGYSKGLRHMQQMVEKINAVNPDLVLVAGDIFDNEYDALYKPDKIAEALKGIKSKYGTYACLGNHDVDERVLAGFTFKSNKNKEASDEMYEFIANSGMTLLQDEGIAIDDSFYLYGRADARRPGRGIDKRATPDEITKDVDKNMPIIVMDHEPGELSELSKAGVDLDLAGHTHDGQMFPGNLTINLFWENPYGLMKIGNMTNITTSGVGVFGPNMRVGTKSEIAVVDVSFK